MSIESYKQLNEELVKKYQELKVYNKALEDELLLLKTQYIELHLSHSQEKQKFQPILHRYKACKKRILYDLQEFEYYIEHENELIHNRSSDFRRSSIRRSSGVISRSPTRSGQIHDISTETITGSKSNYGCERIEEESSHFKSNQSITKTSDCNETLKASRQNVPQRRRAMATFDNNTEDNSISDELITEMQNASLSHNIHITVSSCTTDSLEEDPSEGTIQVARNDISEQLTNLLLPSVRNSCSSTFISTDFEVLSDNQSTPISKKILNNRGDQTDTTNALASEILEYNNGSINSSRPKRSCAPKSLVEPNLNIKLRNEIGAKKSTRKKTKSLK